MFKNFEVNFIWKCYGPGEGILRRNRITAIIYPFNKINIYLKYINKKCSNK
jgi:hypothetical protein